MKTPLNWISLYTDILPLIKEKGTTELAHIYSTHTAEIDGIEEFLKSDKVVVGKVIEAKKHPDSDHLNIVQVDLGIMGTTQIVCGATNVLDATYVPVATVGTILGEDFEIKSTKLRGEISNGMICSEDELGFQEERAGGIMRLENYFDTGILAKQLGKPFNELEIDILGIDGNKKGIKLKEIVFEIDNKFITNRPDLFSVEGNAREFGAIFDIQFQPYSKKYSFSSKTLNTKVTTDKVLAYHLIKVENITSSTSPFGISQMLYRSGINPKFDLVDMTNYVMIELGQPMHAFDADKINGGITVRMAKTGESILALNGETYKLTDKDIVIADDEKVLAIGGIIGGQESAISENTKNIYIESATFDATNIRLTAQRLLVRTDASTRYEKSQDPLLTYRALSRSLDFLAFLGKSGTITGDSEYLDKSQVKNVVIECDKSFICKKIGVDISNETIGRILNQLGFEYKENNGFFNIAVPSWRATKDVSIKEDIAEEIGRINSYSKVPELPLSGDLTVTPKNFNIKFKQTIQNYFSGKKWLEAYNYSFGNEALDEKIGFTNSDNAIRVINAYSADFTLMRRNLLSYLLVNVADNVKISSEFAFFEIAKISHKDGDKFIEIPKIAGASYGISFYAFKSDLLGLLKSLAPVETFDIKQGITDANLSYFHPNKSGEIVTKTGLSIGYFGYLNPVVTSNFELDDTQILYFELNYGILYDLFINSNIEFRELAKFPGINRELNFVMNNKVVIGNVVDDIRKCSSLIRNVLVVDIYKNKEKLGENMQSVTFSILIQDLEKTTTDEEAMKIQNSIIDKLAKNGIEIRK